MRFTCESFTEHYTVEHQPTSLSPPSLSITNFTFQSFSFHHFMLMITQKQFSASNNNQTQCVFNFSTFSTYRKKPEPRHLLSMNAIRIRWLYTEQIYIHLQISQFLQLSGMCTSVHSTHVEHWTLSNVRCMWQVQLLCQRYQTLAMHNHLFAPFLLTSNSPFFISNTNNEPVICDTWQKYGFAAFFIFAFLFSVLFNRAKCVCVCYAMNRNLF